MLTANNTIKQAKNEIDVLESKIWSLSPDVQYKRGFALLYDMDGKPIKANKSLYDYNDIKVVRKNEEVIVTINK